MFSPREIFLDPHPVLRQKAQEVVFPLSKEDEDWLSYMIEHVRITQDDQRNEIYKLQGAVGIAAPQLGVSKRMFVMRVEIDEHRLYEFAFVNPVVVGHSIQKSYMGHGEGCLSVPENHEGYVPRYAQVIIKGFDYLQKKHIQITLRGYSAIVAQHELDHLNGILYYDRIDKENPLKKIENAIVI